MTLLAHRISLNREWNDATIRLLRLVPDESGRQPSAAALRELVEHPRIDAEVMVLVSEAPFAEVLRRRSGDASAVLLGFNAPAEEEPMVFQVHFEAMLAGLSTTLLVCSSGEADICA